MSLGELQSTFQQGILIDEQDCKLSFNEPPQGDAKERFGIYHHGYRARLEEILENDFPLTKALMGEALFSKVVNEYIDIHPSHHYSIGRFGDEFANMIRSLPETFSPVMQESAEFELKVTEIIDMPTAAPFPLEKLQALPQEAWPGLVFTIQTCSPSVVLTHNIPEVWQALTMSNDMVPIEETNEKPWILWRVAENNYYYPLEFPQQLMINSMKEGRRFEDICENLCEFMPEEDVATAAVQQLVTWIQSGLIIHIDSES